MSFKKELLLKETESDMTFSLVDENERKWHFPAHKIMLRLASPIFDEIFRKDEPNQELKVHDIRPNAFKKFLKFIYEEEMNVETPEDVSQLLQLAQKYMVNPLIEKCIDHLLKMLNNDSFLLIYPLTKVLDGQGKTKLLLKCLLHLDENAEEILKKKAFIDAESWIVEEILDRDSLNIEEADLFKAVTRWAHFECCKLKLPANRENIRNTLDKLFYKIRFLTMSIKELYEGPFLASLLSNEERECFLKYKRDKSFSLKDPWIVQVLTRERFMVNSDWVNLFARQTDFSVCRQKDVLYVAFSRDVILTTLTFLVDVEWTETVIIRGSVFDLEQNLIQRWHIKKNLALEQKPEIQQMSIELNIAMEALKCYALKVKCLKGKLCNASGKCNSLTVSAITWSKDQKENENVPLVNFRCGCEMKLSKDMQYNVFWRNHFVQALPSEDNLDTVFQSVRYFIVK